MPSEATCFGEKKSFTVDPGAKEGRKKCSFSFSQFLANSFSLPSLPPRAVSGTRDFLRQPLPFASLDHSCHFKDPQAIIHWPVFAYFLSHEFTLAISQTHTSSPTGPTLQVQKTTTLVSSFSSYWPSLLAHAASTPKVNFHLFTFHHFHHSNLFHLLFYFIRFIG